MGTVIIGETAAKTKGGVVVELLKGKEIAIQLQALLDQKDNHPAEEDDRVLPGELSRQIFRSFTDTLSDLCFGDSAQIPVDCLEMTNNLPSPPPPPPGTKTRRGCYKRRRTSDSWTVESTNTEDGFAWRKYGQKCILNSPFPRCYYRCTHKYDLGCKATKQVQKIKVGKPSLFQTTYINHHTCTNSSTDPYNPTNLIINFYPPNSIDSKNLISFQTRQEDHHHHHPHIPNPNPNIPPAALSSVKLEAFTSTVDQEAPSDAKSSTQLPVNGGYNLEEWAHQPGLEETGPGLQSWESTGIDQFDEMKADPFGGNDFESFFCFDDI